MVAITVAYFPLGAHNPPLLLLFSVCSVSSVANLLVIFWESSMKRFLAAFLILPVAFLGSVQAAPTLITTEQVAAGDAQRDRALVMETFLRPELQAKLLEFGVSLKDAQARVATLTDQEVSALARQIETAPAGGTDILAFVLVIFIVLLITDIMGFTTVFPFVKHGSGKAK